MSGKSKEEIAFELVSKLKGVGVWGENNKEAILDMYAQCLEATSGLREVDGRTPSALRLKEQPAAAPTNAPAQAQRQASPQPAARAPQPQLQAQALTPQQQQVRQQQQRVQQAYQQQPAQQR